MLQQRTVGRDVSPIPVAVPAVKSAEEGKAILEQVRIAISNATYDVVAVGRIRRMPDQPRKYFNPERLLRLSESIRIVGQLTPGYLRVIPPDLEGHDRELIDGERRWQAILMGGIPTFRTMIVDVDNVAAQYIMSLISNFNHEGHTPLEIADGIRVAHEQLKQSMEDIAEMVGFSTMYTSSMYGLRRLSPNVRSMLEVDVPRDRRLPLSAAIEISRLPHVHQTRLAEQVVRREVSLRALRSEVHAVSAKHHLPIRTRTEDPHKQRQRIEQQTSVVRRGAKNLKDRLEATSMQTLTGGTAGNLLAARGELAVARDELDASLKILGDAVFKKTGRR